MTAKVLLSNEALEQVVGGRNGYVYFRQTGDSYFACVVTHPLNNEEIANLLKGQEPQALTGESNFHTEAVRDLPSSSVPSLVDDWTKDYGKLIYTRI